MLNYFDLLIFILEAAVFYLGIRFGVIFTSFLAASGLGIIWLVYRLVSTTGIFIYYVMLTGVVLSIVCSLIFIEVISNSRVFKNKYVKTVNGFFGGVTGLLFGFCVVGTIFLPLSGYLPEKSQNAVIYSYTISYINPWVQEIFPKAQQFVIEKVNYIMSHLIRSRNANEDALE